MKQAGFSLVELSIVLVILGLLTGGILTGQNLIRAAELRSITTQVHSFSTAVHTFRDKYFAIPGDMRNATSFWGDDNAACADAAVTNGTPGTCNGNGDGNVNEAAAPSVTGERYQFWKQLALAGLIEGTYSGLAGSGGLQNHTSSNAPAGKISTSLWTTSSLNVSAGNANFYAADYGNLFRVGIPTATQGPNGPLLKPEEAWNIDMKMDDGKPARGKVITMYWNDLCAAADDGFHEVDDLNASYKLTDNTTQCTLNFAKAY